MLTTLKMMNPKGSIVALGVLMAASHAFAAQFDLVNNNVQVVPGLGGNNAIFTKDTPQSTGTGVFDPFLRLQNGGNDEFQRAFNTSAAGSPPDGLDAKNGVWTHDLLLSSLQVTTYNGVGSYYQFVMDLGEPGNSGSDSARLQLQKFNLYTGNNDAPTAAEIGGNPANLGTLRFDLAGNMIMLLDESSGNGQADVAIYVPTATFAGVTDKYLYLYTEMGLANRRGGPAQVGDAEGSFEEFSALTGPNTRVPDGGTTLALLGCALAGLAGFTRKRWML